jgi:hypothetical protein
MRNILTKFALGSATAALLFTSSAGISAAAPSPAAAPQVQDPWVALSMMSPVGATALSGTAAAAAQPVNAPPAYDNLASPPIPVILVWLATLGVVIYIATRHDHHHISVPNSPA